MSKAGGIAYLLKHGRAPMPTVTRTSMPRAKGVKRMATGGLPNANVPLNYGTVPDYVFIPGGMEPGPDGKPVWKSGRYELRKPAPAAAAPAPAAEKPVVDDGGGRDGSEPGTRAQNGAGVNDAFHSMQQALNTPFGEKAAWAAGKMGLLGPMTQNPQNVSVTDSFGVSPAASIAGFDARAARDDNAAVDAAAARAAESAWGGEARDAAARGDTGGGGGGDNGDSGRDHGNSGSAPGGGAAAGGLMSMKRMAAGGIGSLTDHGGYVGSYAAGGRMLRGPGDGLSDHIPAVIGKGKPARLADGEFVVSADVVSSLGGGSTEAGARKLYAMMDRIRKAAHGSKKQVKKINDGKVLPA